MRKSKVVLLFSVALLAAKIASQNSAPVFEWRFKDYDADLTIGPHMVKDSSASVAKKHLDYG